MVHRFGVAVTTAAAVCRTSFISLARADGAQRRGDVVDAYTPWAAVCEEVAKLKIRLLQAKVTS